MVRQKLLSILITLIAGGMFSSVFFLADDDKLSGFVIAALSFALLIAAYILLGTLRDLIQILRDGQDWTVEVSDTKLSWNSPLPKQMKPFEAELSQITSVEFKKIKHRRGHSKIKAKEYFHIHFRDGKSLKINPFQSGINPYSVFEELGKRGVRFDKLEEWDGSRIAVGMST